MRVMIKNLEKEYVIADRKRPRHLAISEHGMYWVESPMDAKRYTRSEADEAAAYHSQRAVIHIDDAIRLYEESQTLLYAQYADAIRR